MKAYIINLLRSPERKIYMKNVLNSIPIEYEFITAVDGKSLSEDECDTFFDRKRFFRRYSYSIRPGEIGCTLSHQKCYHKIVEDNEPYVLILEDDIEKPSLEMGSIINKIDKLMRTEKPLIILLSGWYWYKNVHDFVENYKLADVFDGVLAHAYVINQAAARLLIKDKPYILADDWFYARNLGIKIQAIYPHIISQKWDGTFKTTINIGKVNGRSLLWYCKNIIRVIVIKILGRIGRFERP